MVTTSSLDQLGIFKNPRQQTRLENFKLEFKRNCEMKMLRPYGLGRSLRHLNLSLITAINYIV